MTGRLGIVHVVAAAALIAAIVTMLLYLDGGRPGAPTGLAVALLCAVVFAVVPWAMIPVGIFGVALASSAVGADNVRTVVIVHAVPLAAGCAALLARRLAGLDRGHYRLPRYGIAMIVVLAVAAAGAIYGLAAGNAPMQVMVAGYQVAVIPAYFFIAVFSLAEPDWRRKAAALFVIGLGVITMIQFDLPGRHGGLMSMFAFPPLIVLAGRTHGWSRVGYAGLAAVFAGDVALSAYRGLWVGSLVAVLVLILRGGRPVRQGLIATGIAAACGVAAVSTLRAVGRLTGDRIGLVIESLDRSAGYRLPEATIGLDVFAGRPLFGAGLGQTTPNVYVDGFRVTDVGPVYHAYYVLLLANLGIIGLCAVLWPVLRAMVDGLRERDTLPLAFAALICGFLVSAAFAGPTDGHWEWGLLPALVLLTRPDPVAGPPGGWSRTWSDPMTVSR